ncbi:beta-galactosidase-like [Ixodes scapularis]
MNVKRAFDSVRRAQGKGPLIVTEYYSGWMDHWGSPHTKTDSSEVLKTFEEILSFNASVNFYMFHGGTNFGFSNGRNPPSQPTSYDYGAPLSEAGDPTDLYYKIRNITSKYLPLPPGKPPVPAPKLNEGTVELRGILSNVTLGGHLLTNWTMEGVPLSTPEQLSLFSKFLTTLNGEPKFEVPGVFFGYFMLPRGQEPLDTFLDPTGFGKGVAILNGFNLGRYWPSIGPQVTLYVPGTLLLPYPQVNLVALFEMESAPEGLKTVKFVDVPNIDGPTPS